MISEKQYERMDEKFMKNRLNWIDVIKGFAIISVVVGHSCERVMTGLNTSPLFIEYLDYFIYVYIADKVWLFDIPFRPRRYILKSRDRNKGK